MINLLFWYSAIAGSLMLTWHLVGSLVYDHGLARTQAYHKQHPYAQAYRRRPKVTVLVLSSSRTTLRALEKTLQSLARNTYRNTETVIISYGISRRCAAAQRQLCATQNTTSVRYHACRANTLVRTREIAATNYAKGTYLFTIEAGMELHQDSVRRAIRHFQSYPRITTLVPHVRIRANNRFTALIEIYVRLLGGKPHKVNTLTATLYATPSTPQITLRQSRVTGAFGRHIRYAHDVILIRTTPTPLAQLFKQHYELQWVRWQQLSTLWRDRAISKDWLSLVRLASSALDALTLCGLPVLGAYFIYLALAVAQPTMLFVLLGFSSLVLLFAIDDETDRSLTECFLLTFGIPVSYGGFLVVSVLRSVLSVTSMVHLIYSSLHRRKLSATTLPNK